MPAAPAPYAVFKLVSRLEEDERPEVVICWAGPDELSGLVVLAGYARDDDAVICPFSPGCGSIAAVPLLEGQRPEPRASLGMFDASARPFTPEGLLSFAAPLALWEEMLGNADESFLKTPTWTKVRRRIARDG